PTETPPSSPPTTIPSQTQHTPPLFLNQQRALALLGGNRSLYVNLARQFFDSWVNFSERWQNAQSLEEQRRIAHTIKGLAGSLGCQPLSEHAGKCEQILRSGSPLDASNAQKLAEQVQRLRLELLQNVISSN
ncbi:MAG: Hpt domain-containing protein, partial [Chthoniobacterales bacterium]|nr:Hpt domain-containing protein [Chthoniobacterales bacterium]